MYNITIPPSQRQYIPYTFCPKTEIHEELIDYPLPPAAQKLYNWLIRKIKAGYIQEFSKKDFDKHCKKVGRKPFCVQWFVKCLKKLIKTRLVKIVHKYGHYTYKVQVFHPWQLDDWLLIGDRSENFGDRSENFGDRSENFGDRSENFGDRSDFEFKNKNFKNRNKNFKNEGSNNDSFEDLSRYKYIKNQDKQSGKDYESATDSQYYKPSTGYNRTKLIQKLNNSCFATQNQNHSTSSNKDHLPKPKPKRRSLSHLIKLKCLKEDLNVDSQQQQGLIPEEKINPEGCSTEVTQPQHNDDTNVCKDISKVDNTPEVKTPEVKTPEVKTPEVKTPEVKTPEKDKPNSRIVNKDWRKHLNELDDLGVIENSTVRKAVQSNSSQRVKNAIALYREQKRHNQIHNPCGYFIQALKENWSSKKINSDSQTDKLALFRLWYDITKELGHCTKYEERDGEFWVFKSGWWESFTDLWDRGFTLEYYRKELKRFTNP